MEQKFSVKIKANSEDVANLLSKLFVRGLTVQNMKSLHADVSIFQRSKLSELNGMDGITVNDGNIVNTTIISENLLGQLFEITSRN